MILPATYLPRALFPSLRRRDPYPPLAVPIVMSWAGMRGVVSLAAALALPDDFPGRDFVLATTFAVILVTVLIQGATLAPLIRVLGLSNFTQQRLKTLSEAAARAQMAAAQLAEVESNPLAQGNASPSALDRAVQLSRPGGRAFQRDRGRSNRTRRDHFTVVLAAVAAGRSELLRLHRDGSIHDSVLHALEQELDLEEMTRAVTSARDNLAACCPKCLAARDHLLGMARLARDGLLQSEFARLPRYLAVRVPPCYRIAQRYSSEQAF